MYKARCWWQKSYVVLVPFSLRTAKNFGKPQATPPSVYYLPTCLLDWDFVSLPKMQKKKTRPISSHFDLSLVNNAYEYISCRLIQIWQGTIVQKMHFWAKNLSKMKVSGLPFSCNAVHEVLTSALITQLYHQNLLHSLSQQDIKSYWSAFSLFCVCQFDAKSTSV